MDASFVQAAVEIGDEDPEQGEDRDLGEDRSLD